MPMGRLAMRHVREMMRLKAAGFRSGRSGGGIRGMPTKNSATRCTNFRISAALGGQLSDPGDVTERDCFTTADVFALCRLRWRMEVGLRPLNSPLLALTGHDLTFHGL